MESKILELIEKQNELNQEYKKLHDVIYNSNSGLFLLRAQFILDDLKQMLIEVRSNGCC